MPSAMKVLVIGSGGREHALAWAAARSPAVGTVYVAPGNAGTARAGGKIRNVEVGPGFDSLADFAETEGLALTIVGPEAPLVAGIRDHFDARGLPCFGPTRAAARLEGSKAFAKAFMARHGIPTAESATFDATELEAAEAHIRRRGAPIVVKADGLAAGKGVVVARRRVEEALEAAREMLAGDRFGAAGRRIVVEEHLAGEEASFTCVTDGEQVLPLASSQDHKPRDDGDRGPNTGGMGAYSPAPVVTADVHDRTMAEVIRPVVRGMAAEGAPYQGFLYAGLMVASDGSVRVVEFNCRFGDPEAQPVLLRLRGDLVDVCRRALGGGLADVSLQWDPRTALGVVLTTRDYPAAYPTGAAIEGLDRAVAGTHVFHAGTALAKGRVATAGGRVLCVVGLGDDAAAAQARAYRRVAQIRWPRLHYRTDIGFRALANAASAMRRQSNATTAQGRQRQ